MEIKINGMKTYLAGMALVLYAVGGYFAGKVDINEAIQSVMIALGIMGLRHRIEKKNIELKPAA